MLFAFLIAPSVPRSGPAAAPAADPGAGIVREAAPPLAVDVAAPGRAAQLSLEDLIAARRAIEEVHWKHRIWPEGNLESKPPLHEVLSSAALREKVLDELAMSEALARFWGTPLTATQLDAEATRMASATRDPAMLRELFAALGDDPVLIRECLARPILADRLVRSAYASDSRLHTAARGRAQEARASARLGRRGGAADGEQSEITWLRRDPAGASPADRPRLQGTIIVDGPEEWDLLRARLAGWFGLHPGRAGRPGAARDGSAGDDAGLSLSSATAADGSPAADARLERAWSRLPLDAPTPVLESHDRFFVAVVSRREPEAVTVVTFHWPKRSFDEWWAEARGPLVDSLAGGSAPPATPSFVAGPAPSTASGEETAGPKPPTVPADSSSGLFIAPESSRESPGPVFVPGMQGLACADDTWTAVRAGTSPEERDSHSAVWTGTEMIIWGGAGVSGALNSGGRYNPATDTWTPTGLGAGVPTARWNQTAIWTGTEMIVWGGYSGVAETNTGARYSPATNGWTAVAGGAAAPSERQSHTAVWTGSEMIVWGGDSATLGFLDTGGRYNPTSNTWSATSTTGRCPAARYLHTAVWTGSEMIVWGGLNDTGLLNSGGKYTPSSDSWSATSTGGATPAARDAHTAVWTGTEMIVWGGSGASGHLNTGARYRPQPEGWTATSTGTGVPPARYLHTAVWAGAEMIVWGGFSGAGYVGTGGRYAPSTNTWTPTPTGGTAPILRGYHTAVWTGSEMIIWGGYYFDGADHELDTGGRFSPSTAAWLPTASWSDRRARHTTLWTGNELIAWGGQRLVPPAAAVSLNSGVRYSPATDSWTETSTGANTPAARLYHSAVWTGTEMIVWGGTNPPVTEFGNGGRYNPTSNSWAALPAGGGAPSARDTHTAVWTGSEMIVWGGWDGLNAFGSGGRFSPASGSWTMTPAGPDARRAHSAVWTGTEMIVWGGESIASGTPASRLNSGARLTPASGQWSATPIGATAPEPRAWHTAVWTGASMIVWGGLDGTVAWKTGGRYTPGSASWSSTDAGLKTPAARAFHSAVWTGSDMIVWGGSDSTGPATILYASGGRYSPATNNWVPTSASAAPTARDGHGAAWTGTEMLVFGGRDTTSTLSTGGRYCAAPCTIPAPSGIPRLSVTSSGVAATIAWTPVAGASSYDLVRGTLGLLHSSGGNFATGTGACLAANIAGTSAPDATGPAPGDGFWYLSRGSSCGGDGTYDSGAPSQAGGRDAEIALSPNACP